MLLPSTISSDKKRDCFVNECFHSRRGRKSYSIRYYILSSNRFIFETLYTHKRLILNKKRREGKGQGEERICPK